MDTIKLGIYEDKLLRRRRETLSCLKRLEDENTALTEQRQMDWIDQAARETEIHLLDHLNEEHAHDLELIQAALVRIHSGTYGVCRACHRPVEKRRLDYFPEAEFCSACQDTREAFEEVH